MKSAYILLAFGLGIILSLAGSLFKIQHYPGADVLLLAGLASAAIGIGLLLVKLVRG